MQKKTLILALIKDDLINSKLVGTLNGIGLEADSFILYASGTIMNLMKFDVTPLQWENIHDEYTERVSKVLQIDIQESPRLVDALAEEIYGFLKKRKEDKRPPCENDPR